MVGVKHLGNPEGFDADAGAVKNKIEAHAGFPARERGGVIGCGGEESGGLHEEFEFAAAGKNIEIAPDNTGFVEVADNVLDFTELLMAGAVGEGEMHENKDHAVEFQFHNQAFHSPGDVMEMFAGDAVAADECIALFIKDGQPFEQAVCFRVFPAVGMVMTEGFGNQLGLVQTSGAVTAGIHLDETDDIGMTFMNKMSDFLEVLAGFSDVAAEREPVHVSAGSVADIVE